MRKLLWQWRAWTAGHKVMIADCGTVWAPTLNDARDLATAVCGGPYHDKIRRISVDPVMSAAGSPESVSVQIECQSDDTDGTDTLRSLAVIADLALHKSSVT